MPISSVSKNINTRQDALYLTVLMAVALSVGIYLIATTVVIAKDGTGFIQFAQGMDSSPVESVKANYQHPGYSFMILCCHRLVGFFCDTFTLSSWIYSAQAVTLVFRLLAIVILYYLGRILVGPRSCFWAMIILIVLPAPTEYGSDALSDWPHLFFLFSAMLSLILGAQRKSAIFFGLAGVLAGLGYLVRPECVQIVIYGFSWLTVQLVLSKSMADRFKTAGALALLLAGFICLAGPYMHLKGGFFPKKSILVSFANSDRDDVGQQQTTLHLSESGCYAAIESGKVFGAINKLVENIGETLMWFFVPGLVVGFYGFCRQRRWFEPTTFFIILAVTLNIFLLCLLHYKYGYISKRHSLAMLVLAIFFIPDGISKIVSIAGKQKSKRWHFYLLVGVGVCICVPKLLRPLHEDKGVLLAAAEWISENTNEDAVIGVSDRRVSFYAQRQMVKYNEKSIPSGADYLAKISKTGDALVDDEDGVLKEVCTFEDSINGRRLVLYEVFSDSE